MKMAATPITSRMMGKKTWVSKYGSRLIFTKNANNLIINAAVEQIDENGSWIGSSSQNYEWNTAGELVKATEEQFFNGEWQNMTEYRNIKWKIFDASSLWGYTIFIRGFDFTSYESYYYNSFDDSWTYNNQILNVFSGDKVSTSYTLASNGAKVDTLNRITHIYYPNGDLKETKGWYKSNGEWLLYSTVTVIIIRTITMAI